MEHEIDADANCNWPLSIHQRIGTGTEGLGKKRRSGDHPNYSIVEYWEELRRLEENCCHSDSCEKLSTDTGEEKSQNNKMLMINNGILLKTTNRNTKNRWELRPEGKVNCENKHKC